MHISVSENLSKNTPQPSILSKETTMQYVLILASGKSKCFYIENVAKMYQKINGGFIVNLIEQDSLDFSENPCTMDYVMN